MEQLLHRTADESTYYAPQPGYRYYAPPRIIIALGSFSHVARGYGSAHALAGRVRALGQPWRRPFLLQILGLPAL